MKLYQRKEERENKWKLYNTNSNDIVTNDDETEAWPYLLLLEDLVDLL